MNPFSSTYQDRILEAYHEVKETSNESLISFYEQHRGVIQLMDMELQLDMLSRYCKALFLTSAYQKHIHVADDVVEKSIFYNIQYVQGVDIYADTLFDKAASLYNLGRVSDATHILEQLLRMEPRNHAYRYLVQRCYMQDRPRYVQIGRALCILLTLSSAFIIALELFVFQPFFTKWVPLVETTRNTTLALGVGSLVLVELAHRATAYIKSHSLSSSKSI